MKKVLLLVFSLLTSSCASNSWVSQDGRYPVSNMGQNIEYYNLSTETGWSATVKPHNLVNYVSWNHAIDLILDGQVTNTFQAHSLEVSLQLKNGEWVSTIEPSIDTLFLVLRKCGLPCAQIGQMTE